MKFNGRDILTKVIRQAGYDSALHIVAENTLFVHPDTVKQTRNKNLLRVVRNFKERGKIVPQSDGSLVMCCDNDSPTLAFLWSIGGLNYQDVQFNHIYSDSKNVDLYTALPNICVTPSFLAKLTDSMPEIIGLLKYRVYDIYGFVPTGHPQPVKPECYGELNWMPFPKPIGNLESELRRCMARSPKSRAARSAEEIGWLYSDYRIDGKPAA